MNRSTAASATANAAAATLRALCQRRAPAREPLSIEAPVGHEETPREEVPPHFVEDWHDHVSLVPDDSGKSSLEWLMRSWNNTTTVKERNDDVAYHLLGLQEFVNGFADKTVNAITAACAERDEL